MGNDIMKKFLNIFFTGKSIVYGCGGEKMKLDDEIVELIAILKKLYKNGKLWMAMRGSIVEHEVDKVRVSDEDVIKIACKFTLKMVPNRALVEWYGGEEEPIDLTGW